MVKLNRVSQPISIEYKIVHDLNQAAFKVIGIQLLAPVQNSVSLKDVRGWQFLTMKAAETFCIVCLPPEEHIS